jgi:predicted HTH domain antitoxin
MCDIVEEYAQEKVNKQAKEMAIALLKEKVFTISKIAELTKLSIEEINQLQNDQLQNA